MTPEELERVRTTVRKGWRPDLRCAKCLLPPTCPNLTDDVWSIVWRRAVADAESWRPRSCTCSLWIGWERLTHSVRVEGRSHWHLCDEIVDQRRPLLCLKCAEEYLGHAVRVGELSACIANYHVSLVMIERRWPHLFRVVRVSNFNHEDHRGDQYFVAQRLTRIDAETVAGALNARGGEHSDDYYRVVADDYVLPDDWAP